MPKRLAEIDVGKQSGCGRVRGLCGGLGSDVVRANGGTLRNDCRPFTIAVWEAYGIVEGDGIDAQEAICGDLERGLRGIDPGDHFKTWQLLCRQ
jgi:hypothetical protein